LKLNDDHCSIGSSAISDFGKGKTYNLRDIRKLSLEVKRNKLDEKLSIVLPMG